jgi:hypothetical protein
VVSADDWLFPECIARMVSLAEANPSVGIVGSYQLSGGGADGRKWRVRWAELPYPSTVIPGREICRYQMLGGPYVFGTPTSLLYRSDLIRGDDQFYPNSTAEADTSACYKCLTNSDFGLVHQVLSYERIHEATVSVECRKLNSYTSSSLSDLVVYGTSYLTSAELEAREKEIVRNYYDFLAESVFRRTDAQFWNYHKRRLHECGHAFSTAQLTHAVSRKLLDLLLNPKTTIEKCLKRLAVPNSRKRSQ